MTAEHFPATSLPWAIETHGDYTQVRGANKNVVCDDVDPAPAFVLPKDQKYIVHAANAYPKLVEALRNMREQVECMNAQQEFGRDYEEAADLLRELGEAD